VAAETKPTRLDVVAQDVEEIKAAIKVRDDEPILRGLEQINRAIEASPGPFMREIEDLKASINLLRAELADLKAVTMHGLTVQRPRAMTEDEIQSTIEAKPDASFLALAAFPAAGIVPGDRFEARHRFQTTVHFLQHVSRGLQVTVAQA